MADTTFTQEELDFHDKKSKLAKDMLEQLHKTDGDYNSDDDGLEPPSAPVPDSHFQRRVIANETIAAAEEFMLEGNLPSWKRSAADAHVVEIHPAVAKVLSSTVEKMSQSHRDELSKAGDSMKESSKRSESVAGKLLGSSSKKSSKRKPSAFEDTHTEDPSLRSLKTSTRNASAAHDVMSSLIRSKGKSKMAIDGGLRSHAHEKPVLKDPIGLQCVAHLADRRWMKLARSIRDTIYDPDFYDDGTYAPMYVRLGIHAALTWDADEKTGGVEGAMMRFRPEYSDAHNKFCKHIIKRQHELYKVQFPWASYADIQVLASYVSIECANGPVIKFTPGRRDVNDQFQLLNYRVRGDYGPEDTPAPDSNAKTSGCPFLSKAKVMPGKVPGPEDGFLGKPGQIVSKEAEKKELASVAKRLHKEFARMGAPPQFAVALIMGGHSFGRAHPEISGYAGPWTPVPGHFTNQFAKKLVSESWKLVDKNMVDKSGDLITGLKPRGMRRQYVNKDGEGELMALVSDMAMFHDAEFGPWVRTYAKDFTRLKKDFGLAFKYMTEAGFQAPKEKSVFGKLIQQICTFRYDIPSYMDSCMATMFGSCWDGFTDMSAGPAKLAPDAPKVGKPYTMEEIAKHNTKEDTWVLINGVVCDVTKFKNEHPGGVDIIMQNAGTDVSSLWNTIHNPEAVKKIAPDTMIGYLA